MLSVFTEKELRKWFESQGYQSPDLKKTDERRAARARQQDRVSKMLWMLQRMGFERDLAIAQRCRGWTPDT